MLLLWRRRRRMGRGRLRGSLLLLVR